MTDERLADLLAGMEAGTLAPADAEELRAAVEGDPALRARASRHLFLARALPQLNRPAPDVRRLVASLPQADRARGLLADVARMDEARDRKRKGRQTWAVASAVGLAAAVAGVFIGVRLTAPAPTMQAGNSPAVEQTGRGQQAAAAALQTSPGNPAVGRVVGIVERLEANRPLARTGEPLVAGRWLGTGAGSSAELLFPQATVELEQNGVLGVLGGQDGALAAPARLFLAQGRLRLAAARAVAPALALTTPHADLLVGQARAVVSIVGGGTRVEVQEGVVRVKPRAKGTEQDIGTRQSALIRGEGTETGDEPVTVMDHREVLLVSDRDPGRPGAKGPEALPLPDVRIKERLEKLGFRVLVVFQDEPPPPLEGRRLIVLTEFIESSRFDWDLRSTPVPILVSEPMLYMRMGMVADNQRNSGFIRLTDSILVENEAHPLAAGLQGNVVVSAAGPVDVNWGHPAGWGVWIARSPRDAIESPIFAYDRGQRMPVGLAPARRVGFFLRGKMATALTEDGWKLFDAAVRWCAGEL